MQDARALTAPQSWLWGVSREDVRRPGPHPNLYLLLIALLVIDYGRPTLIMQLRPALLLVGFFTLAWAFGRDRVWAPLLTAQAAFVAWNVIGVPLASNNFMAYVTTRIVYGNFLVALVMAWLLTDQKRYERTVWAWMLTMGYVALYSITHGGHGPGGPVGDENDTALALGTAFAFAFFGTEGMRGARQVLCYLLAILFAVGVIVTFSRGGFVGLSMVVLYCFLASRNKLRNVGLAVVGVLAFLVFAPQEYKDEIKTIQNTDRGTAKTRQFLWATATNMWKDHKVMGVGGWGFGYLAQEYIPDPEDFETEDDRQYRHYYEHNWGGKTVHSAYFQLLAEQGAGGVLLFASIIWLHFRTLRRLRKVVWKARDLPMQVKRTADMYCGALGAAMVGYLAAGAFVSVGYYPYYWYFGGLAVALDVGVRRSIAAADTNPPAHAAG